MTEKRVAPKWLLLRSVMLGALMTTSLALPTTTTSPSQREHQGGGGAREEEKKKSQSPASPIRPLANTPLEVREGGPDNEAVLATNFLKQYGYTRQGEPLDFLQSPPAGSDPDQQEDQQTRALKLFQRFFNLRQTGTLDRDTVALMKRSRCGVTDIPPPDNSAGAPSAGGRQSPSNYALLGSKWDKNRLSWKMDTFSTRQLSSTVQRKVLQEAFETWRRVAPLDFYEVHEGEVDIDIKFGNGYHGDDYPFDGRGKVLAHAFGPGVGDIDGDMHIDDAEDWSSAKEGGSGVSDLYLVATHELGHSLGLSHSSNPDALMYPYYGLMDRLGPDDIKAIQSLYGIRQTPPTTPAPVTRRPTTRTDRSRPQTTPTRAPTATPTSAVPVSGLCGVEFDVVIQDPVRSDLYDGIHGSRVYRFTTGGVLPGFPSHLHSAFPGAPAHAEAVFTVPETNSTYFVKDNKVWRYRGSQLDADYPKDLNPRHFPYVIRFVLPIVDSNGHRRIFVFGRTYWWEYNFDELPTGTYYKPRLELISRHFPAITSDVKYGVMGQDNYIYLITSNGHIAMDAFRRAIHGGEQDGHPQWMMHACQMRQTASGAESVWNVKLTWFAAILSVLLSTVIRH